MTKTRNPTHSLLLVVMSSGKVRINHDYVISFNISLFSIVIRLLLVIIDKNAKK